MKRTALLAWIVGSLLLIAGSGPTTADNLRGDLQVMRPDGTVFRISLPSADGWWDDYYRARCASCKGPRQAAQLLAEVEGALGTRFAAGPRYLLLPESLELGWPHAWLFYPSTDRTPAYVVRHGGIGGDLRWDVWMPATERMEALILEGAGEPSSASEQTDGDRPGARVLSWVLVLAILAVAVSWWLVSLVRRHSNRPTGGA